MSWKNEKLSIFEKGNFKPLNREFITETINALSPIINIQKKYNKLDNDTFFNELKDSIIGAYLDYGLINTEKHGLDAKKINEDKWLEVKQVSFSSQSWSATFNDTTLEKAEAFKDIKTLLAVGVWDGISDILFLVYGQNFNIGEYLENKVKECNLNSRRSTQTISILKLVKEYNFKIKPINKTRQEVIQLFRLKFNGEDWWSDNIE